METEEELIEIAPDNDTVCIICNAEFLDPEDLTVHLAQVHASEPIGLIPCHFCSSSQSDLEAYACHIRDAHLQSLKLCMYCSKGFTDNDDLGKHVRKHYSAKKSHKKCSQCSIQFENISELELHEYENHNNNFDGILLQDYYPIFSSVFNMKASSLIQSAGTNITYLCVTCEFICHNLDKYIYHLQNNECRAYTCNNCSKPHKTKKNLSRHVKTVKCSYYTKKWEKSQECPHCFKGINSLFFFSHVKQCKPIKCTLCNIVFKSMNDLSEHQSKEHPVSIEVTLCKFCSRQCVGSTALLKHMSRVHKNNLQLYKYKCVQCEMLFKHPQKLFAHYFMNHKELEPYTCKICNRKFRIRKNFTIHIKLDHKSIGYVEFDKNYHVFFSASKSENPFTPTCVIPEEELRMYTRYQDNETRTKIVRKGESRDQSNEKINLDILNQTETEGHITEVDTEMKKNNTKRKKRMNTKVSKRFKKRNIDVISLDSSDDDKPLVSLTKRRQLPFKKPLHMLFKTKKTLKNNRKQLTCKKCNKYCYTFQNYQHHMSLHKKNERKKCIKCSKVFKSKEKLQKHIETDHSSSKLTETLRTLLEKRKRGITAEAIESNQAEKFIRTVKKAKTDNIDVTATIKLVENDLSLQKFIENFTPESNDSSKTKNAVIESSITVKMINNPFYRKPFIKMTKFEPKPVSTNVKLALPVKFKQDVGERVTATMKIVQTPVNLPSKFVLEDQSKTDINEEHYTDHYKDMELDRTESIPEVGHEVLLEGSEETPKPSQIPHKIVIPKMLQGCHDISIAHLLPEAPYFKIVKVNDVLNDEVTKEQNRSEKKEFIKLADGTKLVTVNPLAHLLGDKKLEQILEPVHNKYYKPRMGRNVENLFTKAIEKANTPTKTRKKRPRLPNNVSSMD